MEYADSSGVLGSKRITRRLGWAWRRSVTSTFEGAPMIRLYANRGTVGGMWRWARSRTEGLIGPFRQHEKALKGIAQSAITPFVLLGLLFPLWFVSKRLAALIMFLLWISAIYQLAIRLGRRAKSRPAIQRTIAEQPESSA